MPFLHVSVFFNYTSLVLKSLLFETADINNKKREK